MPSNDEWQLSWSKLRDLFEDWSLSYSGMRLCIRKIDGPLHATETLHQRYNLTEPLRDILGNEQEGVIVMDALGMGTCHSVGLQANLSMEWWIASPKLADIARYGGEPSELHKLRAELANASEQFKALADQASLILSQRPKGVAIRYPWKEKGACDSRLWISLLLEFAEDFQHSTLKIAGYLPVSAMGVFQPCDPAGLEYIDPNPGAASMIVLELLRTGDWKEKLGVKIKSKSSGPTVNERMKAEMASNLETVKGWTAKRWAEHLNCGQTTVKETETWKSLSQLRQQAKAEKRKDRRRR